MVKVLENPLYYLENFHQVLAWISARYHDLLAPDEHDFITTFGALPQPSQALFVRMVVRKGLHFRASKLSYCEIGNTHTAALPLVAAGLVEHDPQLTLEQLFDLLLKPEIGALFQLPPHARNARKAEQLAALAPLYDTRRHFSAWYKDSGDHVYHAVSKTLCDRLRLIFFGNFHQDWSEFVLAELGVFKYEKVEFSPSSRGFRCRRDIDDYLALQQCREQFLADAPVADVLVALAATAPDNDWLASRRAKLLFQIGQHLEKQHAWPAAFDVYAHCTYPGARLRAIRVLEKDARHDEAYDWLGRAEQAPESEAERQHLLRIGPRLRRKLGHAKVGRPTPRAVTRVDLNLPLPTAPCYVEGVVRDHLTQAGAPVYYVENALINSLFGLLCWDAIFKPIPGAFFHPFHSGPADLHSADFQQRRAAEFAACLAQLDSGAYQTTIRANYAAKAGTLSPFVYWEVLEPALMDLALDCIPPPHLKKWFERILLDIKANRSGFPDLIQFWPEQHRYNMIEVKGPGDRLQDNQKRWIDYCAQHDMPVTVCYLQWSGAAP